MESAIDSDYKLLALSLSALICLEGVTAYSYCYLICTTTRLTAIVAKDHMAGKGKRGDGDERP